MKKTIIITALLLSTGLTAWSLSKKSNETKLEKLTLNERTEAVTSTAVLATAD